MTALDQVKVIAAKRLKVLEDFYYELSGTDSFEVMTNLWAAFPKAAEVADLTLDSHRWVHLSDHRYRDEVNQLDQQTYAAFGQRYVDFAKLWDEEYAA